MGRKNKVEKLPETEFDFVIRAVTNGRTDREISAEFEAAFNQKLDKNSINRWRNTVGEELADRYRLARFQAKQLREDLLLEDKDDYQNVIKNIEERLLTATREVVRQDPNKLLLARQREENFRLKREQIELKRQELEFAKSKHESESSVRVDRLKIISDSWRFILAFLAKNEPAGADLLTKHSDGILDGLEGYVENQTA